jgi:molecular chaperone DnaJ
MDKRDYYDVLGVGRDADDDQVKRAYRKLALKYHPDRSPDDKQAEEKFKEATEAYEVLRDSSRRAQYDRFGHNGLRGADFGFDFGAFDLGEALRAFMRDFGSPFGGLEDFFGGGAGPRRSASRGGGDLRVKVALSLEEIAEGSEKRIRLKRLAACKTCGGGGAKKGTSAKTCSACRGTGETRTVQRSFLGQIVNVSTCAHCGGEGKIIAERCQDCRGEGRVALEETISVKIPAGISSDNYIPIAGKGNDGLRGGRPGSLLVYIEEQEHPVFERHGENISCDVPISFAVAALGGQMEVPTLDGPERLVIPAGTQSQKIFVLRGKGLKRLDGRGSGDLLVRVTVWVPTKLSKEEREIIEKMPRLPDKERLEPGREFLKKLRKLLAN